MNFFFSEKQDCHLFWRKLKKSGRKKNNPDLYYCMKNS
ncbi:hypothetical protein BSM4216_2514 [Bacillus smithii]|nr:hypothetical protein BSM4216_2514 [Bacillus smithii]